MTSLVNWIVRLSPVFIFEVYSFSDKEYIKTLGLVVSFLFYNSFSDTMYMYLFLNVYATD